MQFTRPIAFIPELARMLGGVEEAVYYQQLHYWSTRGNRKDGFIYKTIKELEQETTLTRKKQDRIRKKLVDMEWVAIKKTHAPNGSPTLHYKCLIEISISTKRTNGNAPNGQMEMPQRDKCSITESTTESTTKGGATSAPFSLKEEIKKLEDSDRRDLNIVALYLEHRQPDLTNKEQYQIALKRHLRPAKQLTPFTDNQILRALNKVKKEYTDTYTLETILKILTK